MKRLLTTALLVFVWGLTHAQINALTDSGDPVILNENGTWQYADSSSTTDEVMFMNPVPFTKSSKSDFLVKSKRLNIGIWMNPKEWTFEKEKDEDVTELTFKRKNEDLYGMIISEKIEIPVDNLIQIAFENAREAAPDVKIIEKEYRTVNDLKVVMMKMEGTIQGIRFIYYSYYYSNENGTVQFVTYTSKNLFKKYEPDMLNLLNGIAEY